MRKILKWIFYFLMVFLVGLLIWVIYNNRDRHPGYDMNLSIQQDATNVQYQAGSAKKTIIPSVIDTWNDANGNARYDKEESYNDLNGNGKFDAVWIAGFHNNKPANGIHDDVWARTMVLDDGNHRIALVSLDAIGFMYSDVIDIRKALPDDLHIDYTLIASTHTHESIDLIGICGPGMFSSGQDRAHMKWLKEQVIQSIDEACAHLRPATFVIAQDLSGRDSILTRHTRKPF